MRATLPGAARPVRSGLHRALGGILAVGVTLMVGWIVVLAFDLREDFGRMRTAQSDNVEWSLAQYEVEFLRLRLAIAAVETGTGDLADLRERFDIFFSRAETLRDGRVFALVRATPEVRRGSAATMAFLERAAPIVDGPDAGLRAAAGALDRETLALMPAIRALAIGAIGVMAGEADGQRSQLLATFEQLTAFAALVVAELVILLLVVLKLDAKDRRLAARNMIVLSRLEAVIETSLDAVLVADRQGCLLECNGAAERVFGLDRQRAAGAELARLIVGGAGYAGLLAQARSGRAPGRVRIEGCRADGTAFPAEASVAISPSDDGEIVILFVRDLSAEVASERALLQARDDALAGERAKARFLAIVSHEIRTPLNGLLGALDLLGETGPSPAQAELLEVMHSSGRLLLQHVGDVLDIARLDARRMPLATKPFDLGRLLEETVESQAPVARAAGNHLALSIEEALPRHRLGDPLRLRQILLNLVSNAIKFTHGGRIEVAAAAGPDGGVELRVSDTGIGIAADQVARIFEDFVTLDASYTRSSEGTGLGLGIVRRLVQAMGGEIGVRSEPGAGSVFWLRLALPVAPDPAVDPAEACAGGPAVPSRPLRVLMAVDNVANLLLLRRMLERDGHEVVEARDGEAAVVAAADRFDVVLMDVSMPRLDGVSATRAIRAGAGPSRAVPVVAITAHAMPEDLVALREAGLDEVLTKPVDRAALRRVLAQVAAEAPLQPSPVPACAGPAPLFDEAVLGTFRSELGPETAGRLLEAFWRDGEAALRRLGEAGPAGDGVRHEVHQLAGSAGIFGMARLREALAAIEAEIGSGRAAEARRRIDDLPPLWTATRQAMASV